jgi:hypothetical protein
VPKVHLTLQQLLELAAIVSAGGSKPQILSLPDEEGCMLGPRI